MNEQLNGLLILLVIAVCGFLMMGGGSWISNSITERSLNKNVPLPNGAKWYYGLDGLILKVDVNHGTGNAPDWRNTVNLLKRLDVEYGNDKLPEDFLDASKDNVIALAQWMREQYINTDEFTTPIPFPLEEGQWAVKYDPFDEYVQVAEKLSIKSRGFRDHRDVVVAMVKSVPYLRKAEQDKTLNARQQRSVARLLEETPALTTREYKPV